MATAGTTPLEMQSLPADGCCCRNISTPQVHCIVLFVPKAALQVLIPCACNIFGSNKW